MVMRFSNNGISTLAAGISDVDTELTVAVGEGVLFADLGVDETQQLTITDTARSIFETVTATAKTDDTITITRAQEGTTALAWDAGSIVFTTVTAGVLEQFQVDIAGAQATAEAAVAAASAIAGGLAFDDVNATVTGESLGLSYVPRETGESPIGSYLSYGKEVVLRASVIDIGTAPDWQTSIAYNVGDTVTNTTDTFQYRVVRTKNQTATFAIADAEPTNGGYVDTAGSLTWYRTDLPYTLTIPDEPSLTNEFVVTCIGVAVTTDGFTTDSATISVGDDTVSPTSLLDAEVIAVDSTSTSFFFGYPMAKKLPVNAFPVITVDTAATLGSLKATVTIKGYFIEPTRVV